MESRLIAELPRLRPYLRRLAARSGGLADADDLEQEVAARALRSRARYNPAFAIGPWLRTTAFRAFLDSVGRRRRLPRSLAAEEAALAAPETLAAEEWREETELLLDRLPSAEREILRRFHLLEQPIKEIGRALDLPEGTVKSHLHRARRKLAALPLQGWSP